MLEFNIRSITPVSNGGSPEPQPEGNPWTQPVLSNNGVVGGDSFAVFADSEIDEARQAWKAFDGNTVLLTPETDQWHSISDAIHYIGWYNPEPLIIDKVTVYNGADNVLCKDFLFEYSDNGDDWTFITGGTNTNYIAGGEWSFDVKNSGQHKYYRIHRFTGEGLDWSYWGITEIKIDARVIE